VGVLRGGGWDEDAVHCTVSRRKYKGTGYRDDNVGFRLARDP
jgi:formylglycine-generating enzyme required for sulfatase activity